MSKKEEKEEGARSFAVFIRQLADGEAEQDLSNELHELVEAVTTDAANRSVSSGTLTLKLKIKVDAKRQVAIAYDITTKEPPKLRPGSMMYVTKGGNLTPENPRQQSLPLREVAGTATLRDLVEKTADAREV